MEYCDILVNDTVVSYSDFDGTFEIPVPKSAKRLVATFRDYQEEYAESTVVLFFRKGTTTFHKIHLRPEVPAIEFDAEVEKAVPIANDDVAQVIIPANSLIDKDGNPKKGKAKVKIQFNDPRNERDILESPGEFSTVDEEGEEQLLRTYGVFKIKVQDENNQNLALTKNLHINFDLEQLTGEKYDDSEPMPHLWWLNEKTGRWMDAGELKRNQELTQRPRRQTGSGTYSGDIQFSDLQRIFNIDKIDRRCLAKVRADADGEGIDNAKVTSIFVNENDQVLRGYVVKYTSPDGNACIATQCDSNGYIEVEKDGSPLLPKKESLPDHTGASIVNVDGKGQIRIKFNPGAQTNNGPVYQRGESLRCKRNSADQSFTFHSNVNKPSFKVGFKPADNYREAMKRISSKKRCLLRVLTSGPKEILIKAESYSGKDEKTLLGYDVRQTEPVNNTDNLFVTCFEHWCPDRDNTLIHFKVLTEKCERSHVKNILGKGRNKGLSLTEAKVSIPKGNQLSGFSLGIWLWSRKEGDDKDFETYCVNNKNKVGKREDLEGYAVKFNCTN